MFWLRCFWLFCCHYFFSILSKTMCLQTCLNHRANGRKSIYLRVADAIIDLPRSVHKRNVQPVLMQRITSTLLSLWNFICITFVIYCLYEIVDMFLQILWFKMWQNVLFKCCKLNKKWETFKYLNSYFQISLRVLQKQSYASFVIKAFSLLV